MSTDLDRGTHPVLLPGPKTHRVRSGIGTLHAQEPGPVIVAEIAELFGPFGPRVPDHRGLRTGFAHGHLERSEEHTSELQSRGHLVCRLLLEKKKYLVYRT